MSEVTDQTVRPGIGIGAVELGMSAAEVERVAGSPLRRTERGGFESLYFASMTVGILCERVTMVVAEPASSARLEGVDNVRLGMAYTELREALRAALRYDEEEGLWRSEAHQGVLFEIARPAEPGEEPLDPPLVPELYDITRPAAAVLRRMFVQ